MKSVFALRSTGRVLCVALAICSLGAAHGQEAPTLAWQEAFSLPRQFSFDDEWPQAVDTDATGNAYALLPESDGYWHLKRFNRDGVVPFDIKIPASNLSARIHISPLIDGQQFVYAEFIGSRPGPPQPYAIYKFTVSGAPAWPQPYKHPMGPNQNLTPAGFYADNLGNVFVGFSTSSWDYNTKQWTNNPFQMLELDSSGGVVNSTSNSDVLPGAQSYSDGHYGFYVPPTHSWVVTGFNPNSGGGARWALYDATTGAETLSEYAPDDSVGADGYYHWYSFVVRALPEGYFAVCKICNQVSVSNTSQQTYTYTMRIFSGGGTLIRTYPSSGTYDGVVCDLTSMGPGLPIYVTTTQAASTRFTLTKFDWSGDLLSTVNNQNAELLFATPEGFFTAGPTYREPMTTNGLEPQTELLQHYEGATLTSDWKGYYYNPLYSYGSIVSYDKGSLGGFANFYDASHPMTRCSYGLLSVPHSDTQTSMIYVNRFVTGLNLSSVTSPSSTKQWSTVPVTITLNAPAGQYGYVVGLISNSAKLLMPNGTTSENFRVPAGETSTIVNLSAQSVSANVTVTVLATQNYVRRTTGITVTP